MAFHFFVDPDIAKASTLPASFYRSPEVFTAMKEGIFKRVWQLIPPDTIPGGKERAVPFRLLEGFLQEPLLISRGDDDALHCLSNVCTHRGNILVNRRSESKKLVCGYHGRRFSTAGTFEYMPEFKEAINFPSPCDHLAQFPLLSWGPMWFTALDPSFDLSGAIGEMEKRVGFLDIGAFRYDAQRSRTYEVAAHWALYCDNYLEGFHIPFVHKGLDAILDYGQYETCLFDHGSLQTGFAVDPSESVFDLPEGHMDFGKRVAAYYYWLFPNIMFNFYPWGLSVNIVSPLSQHQTRVRFISYVRDASLLDKGAGSALDKVEMEDEAVVEAVHQGLQSSFYDQGRFSPSREKGVHHFHRMLADYMNSIGDGHSPD